MLAVLNLQVSAPQQALLGEHALVQCTVYVSNVLEGATLDVAVKPTGGSSISTQDITLTADDMVRASCAHVMCMCTLCAVAERHG